MTGITTHREDAADALMNTYQRFDVTFTHGEGPWLYDAEGRSYLDFLSGLAVTSLGHAHPAVTHAISSQASRLLHVSNLFHTQPQAQIGRASCRERVLI